MSKKIVFIHGSPRHNGNTRAISQIAIRAAQEKKADVFEINAPKLEFTIPGCAACTKCHQSVEFTCAAGDQLAETVATLIDYDVIVFATPTYWMSYPAQLKMLIDRMGSLMKFTASGEIQTPLAGKEIVLLATGSGDLEKNLDLLEQQLSSIAFMLSCTFYSCLFPNVPHEADTLTNDATELCRAEQLGHQLALSAAE